MIVLCGWVHIDRGWNSVENSIGFGCFWRTRLSKWKEILEIVFVLKGVSFSEHTTNQLNEKIVFVNNFWMGMFHWEENEEFLRLDSKLNFGLFGKVGAKLMATRFATIGWDFR